MLSILQKIKSFCSETLVMLMYYKSVLKTLYVTFVFVFSNKVSLFPQKKYRDVYPTSIVYIRVSVLITPDYYYKY